MNFFGHAFLARQRGDDPRFLLGSMLPDFCSMARLRIDGIDDDELERGVAFHHTTDDAFHGAPLFQRLMHDAQEELEQAGVAYGPALAVGHVGVELLLDGWLAQQQGPQGRAVIGFRRALEAEVASPRWRDGVQSEQRWQHMRVRLKDGPLPQAYADPAFVADRMVFILRDRPRLALDDHGAREVANWAPRAAKVVAEHAPSLIAQVEARLEDAAG